MGDERSHSLVKQHKQALLLVLRPIRAQGDGVNHVLSTSVLRLYHRGQVVQGGSSIVLGLGRQQVAHSYVDRSGDVGEPRFAQCRFKYQ